MINKSKINNSFQYFLLYYLIAVTGIPFFVGDIFIFIGIILSIIYILQKGIKRDSHFIYYISSFAVIIIVQAIKFGTFELNIVLGFLGRIIYAYLTIQIVGKKLSEKYVNIIYFFTIISFIFWIPMSIFPQFGSFLLSNVTPFFNKYTYFPTRHHFIIYTVFVKSLSNISQLLPRNAGPFWEPGGFGIFLIIALIFNYVKTKKILEKKNILFIIAILTTQSTGAYITLFFFLGSVILLKGKGNRRILYMLIIMPIFIFISSYYFSNLNFLGKKITKQLAYAQGDTSTLSRNRIVSAKEDLKSFFSNPLVGRGRFKSTRFEESGGAWEGTNKSLHYRNNGTTSFLQQFGLLGFFLFFGVMLKSFKKFCLENSVNQLFAYFIVLTILIAGFSQGGLFTKPFFFGLPFLFLVNKKNMKVKNTYANSLNKLER